jgi:hypothetical protein
MDLDTIKRKVYRWINEDVERDVDEVYETFVEFIKVIAPMIDDRFKRIDRWNIEILDEVVDRLCDYLYGSSIAIDLWDEIWDAKIDRKTISKEKIKAFSKIIDEVERRAVNKHINSYNN